ncbi:isochorismatase [Bordetella ansorpii]|uniref:Isochorismatase n=1 Tax=Bordetella ansorpii TaxID=288768 RepID=A0A157S5N9_9BORD|nr:isochorismatase family protein [Bordetella ansorpii]SAI65738.1 isochorismatase [Bordetella ansorpii]
MPAISLKASDCTLLVIDMQARLLPAIHDGEAVLAATLKLARAARLLDIPVVGTEQQPGKLGATVPELAGALQAVLAKTHFSAAREPGFEAWLPPGRRTVLVAGVEAHVCVLQTLLDLRQRGWQVALVSDAVGSRRPSDHHAASRRARAGGADIVSAEMAIFEWMETCEHPRFREVLRLVK